MQAIRRAAGALIVTLLAVGMAHAAIDLRNATVHTLDNGLTMLLLEDRAFPLVSVQMLYRSGARDDPYGKSGLAHFVEHMAFRGSENFPGTDLAGAIDAVGGEWHGYTYIDQTTYFATAPREALGLLLDIEAERMARLVIDAADIPAEQGAVLAEMQGYENDPAAVLHDWSVYGAIVAHPYRNNTIGWAGDVRSITRDDVVDFYARHYQPGNAVLAIVGDIDTNAAMAAVRERFGDLPGRAANPLPVTTEPLQQGERRIDLLGPVDRQWFQFAWPAPAASDRDWPAFLLAQELLAGSSGVNFLQNDWGTPARPSRPLAGITDDIRSWQMPTAAPYVFTVKGSIAAAADAGRVEREVTAAIRAAREAARDAKMLSAARRALQDELLLDLQTTEDAAHQLAFFTGIGARQALLELPQRLALVSAADLERVIDHYLDPRRRTVAWYRPGSGPAVSTPPPPEPVERATPSPLTNEPAPDPALHRLSGGLPVLLQSSPLSATAHLLVAWRGADLPASGVEGLAAFSETVPADRLPALIGRATTKPAAARPPAPAGTPAAQMEALFRAHMGEHETSDVLPAAIAVAGRFDESRLLETLEQRFGDLEPAPEPVAAKPAPARAPVEAALAPGHAQARIGYIVPAPPPGSPRADAWQALLYLFSNGYGGRLGRHAVSEQGLVYYIDSGYRSDGVNAWVTLSSGVDPAKLDAMQAALESELARLRQEPPTREEFAEALRHRLGRAVSAAQGNAELADRLIRHWAWHGELPSVERLRERLAGVEHADLLAAVDDFTAGTILRVAPGD